MEDSTDQREFAKDLIDAGYKTYGSEEENQILRKHNLSRDESLSNDKNRVYKDNTTGKAFVNVKLGIVQVKLLFPSKNTSM